jgi:hypothetical protein
MNKNSNGLKDLNTVNLKMTVDGKVHDIKGFSNDIEKSKEECTSITESSNEGFACKEEIRNSDNDSKITKINPIEFLKRLNQGKPNKLLSRIKFDKDLITNFKVTRNFNCDGTFALIDQEIGNAITQAIMESPYYFLAKSEKIDLEKLKGFGFIMGEIMLKEEFGTVSLKCGEYPGEHVTVEVPIKAEFIQ